MQDKVNSTGNKYVCLECQNENEIPVDAKVGDVIECAFCGLEYEVEAKDEAGNYTLRVIEEEK